MRKELVKAIVNAPPPPRAEPVKYRRWGEGLEHEAVMQMEKGCLLPVAVAGALMPDAHVPDLPSELKRLAWLSLDSQEGQEYREAMELMGRYAADNQALAPRND